MQDVRDKVQGILFGLAAGDRIGGPLSMALCLANCLTFGDNFDPLEISKSYLEWWRREGFDTGPVAENVFKLIESGFSNHDAVKIIDEKLGGLTAGCNPAHRSAPLAMVSFIATDQLDNCAVQEALLTHKHPLAGDVAAAVVVLCRFLLIGTNWKIALKRAAEGRLLRTREALKLDGQYPQKRGGFAPDVLNAAIYFLDESKTFEEAIINSIRFAGLSNYCPVLVGAIGGARWGKSCIPSNMLGHCKKLAEVEVIANRLSMGWNSKLP